MENGIGSYYRFLNGDRRAFEQIVVLYSDAITRFAYGFLKDKDAAEDVMMDVFAALLVKKRRFKQEAAFKAYLFKSARNKAIDKLRERKRRILIDIDYDLPDDACPAVDVVVLEEEKKKKVVEAVRKLPAQYRDAIYLVYFEDFDPTEAAVILKKSRKQIYNALFRARASLKKLLSEENG